MAQSIQALREKRAAAAKSLRNHYDKHDGKDAPAWDDAAQKTYDDHITEIANIDGQIKRLQNVLDVEASTVLATRAAAEQQGISEDEATHNRNQKNTALQAYLRGGISA